MRTERWIRNKHLEGCLEDMTGAANLGSSQQQMFGILSWLAPLWAQTCVRIKAALLGGCNTSVLSSYHLSHRHSGLFLCTSSGRECYWSHTKLELSSTSEVLQIPECGNHGTLTSGKRMPWPRSTLWMSMISRVEDHTVRVSRWGR